MRKFPTVTQQVAEQSLLLPAALVGPRGEHYSYPADSAKSQEHWT